MSHTRKLRRATAVLAGVLAGMGGAAAVPGADSGAVYRWTDDRGVVHFSDSPPERPPPDTRVMPLPRLPPAAHPEAQPFSVINQARRMAEERRARERARLEELRARAEVERARAQAPPLRGPEEGSGAGRRYIVPLYPPAHRRFGRPDLREFPEGHPAYRPYRGPRPTTPPPRSGSLVPGRR